MCSLYIESNLDIHVLRDGKSISPRNTTSTTTPPSASKRKRQKSSIAADRTPRKRKQPKSFDNYMATSQMPTTPPSATLPLPERSSSSEQVAINTSLPTDIIQNVATSLSA